MILSNVLTFGKFSVFRKPIINGGAIRPVGLLYKNMKQKRAATKTLMQTWIKIVC